MHRLPTPMSSPRQVSSTGSPRKNKNDPIFHCRVCFKGLPATASKDPTQPPFWLTSCGHIVCSDHIFPEGAPENATAKKHCCPHCEKDDISLVGVDGAEVFTSIFQYENVLRFAAHYKSLAEKLSEKLDNQKSVLLRVKDELLEARELKRKNEVLNEEVTRLREQNEQYRAQLHKSPRQLSHPSPSTAQLHPESIPSDDTLPANTLKRKAEDALDNNSQINVRNFRRELNGNMGMAPPPAPLPARGSNYAVPNNVNILSPTPKQSPVRQNQLEPDSFLSRHSYENFQERSPPNNFYQHQPPRCARSDESEYLQQPSHRQPSYQQPSHQQPSHQQPSHQQPSPRLSHTHQGLHIPAQTPLQTPRRQYVSPPDAPQAFNSGAPLRTPMYIQRPGTIDTSHLESRTSYISPLTAGIGFQAHMKYGSPSKSIQSRGRLTLPPQTSSRFQYQASTTNMGGRPEEQMLGTGSSGVSPFFSRPTSVATFEGNFGREFANPFLQRPQSAMPNPPIRRTEELRQLVHGSGGFMDRPGLRKVVRRE
ncbi:hypothetical protein BZA77DRAFT_342837 [Pyronema omphalodes]|nr:hypothetical protein BZA77DRAFT_342837 [Pyronema omphalodes]